MIRFLRRLFRLRRKSRPAATITSFFGFNVNDGPEPKTDRETAARTMSGEIYSLADFIKLVGISRPTFYNLKKRGEAPQFFKMGRKVMITREAYEQWIADRVARTNQRTLKVQGKNNGQK